MSAADFYCKWYLKENERGNTSVEDEMRTYLNILYLQNMFTKVFILNDSLQSWT